jgi:hypothetical protein
LTERRTPAEKTTRSPPMASAASKSRSSWE